MSQVESRDLVNKKQAEGHVYPQCVKILRKAVDSYFSESGRFLGMITDSISDVVDNGNSLYYKDGAIRHESESSLARRM